jgi:hypothetical protein
VSNSSTISNSSIAEEQGLDDVKEEESPMEIPDDEICAQIAQQVLVLSETTRYTYLRMYLCIRVV